MAEAAPAHEHDHDEDPFDFGWKLRFRTPRLRGLEPWPQRVVGRRRFHLHLATIPVFSGCTRRQIARIARWGDVIEVQPGDVLAREDRSNHWFFVVLTGAVRVTHHAKEVATIHRGGHFGEIAVIGFRPQPATVTAVAPTVLFVLGRRHFVSLAAMDRSIQGALFPGVGPDDYRAHVRKLHEDGRVEWNRLKPHPQPVLPGAMTTTTRPRPPGRRLTFADAVAALTVHDQSIDVGTNEDRVVIPRMSRPMAALVAAAVFTAIFAVVSVIYHPPLAVMSAARPIDVVNDITITGRPVTKPTGRYLLTAVNVGRPHLAGTIVSWLRGRRVVSVRQPGPDEVDVSDEQRIARRAFLQSHKQAIALAERSLGVDPKGIAIVIRDRGIGGPSAGLTYALAIIDMLDPGDLARDRVIAATGELQANGRVASVGFVAMKSDVASGGRADLFIVPLDQMKDARRKGLEVYGVRNLEDAVAILRKR